MIHFVRTAQITPGRINDAVPWAFKIIAYVNNLAGTDFQLIRNVTGDGHQLHFYTTYASMADFEAAGAKITADQGYQAIAAEAEGLSTGFADHLYQTITM